MMNPLLVESLASVLRHVLTIGAGYLVARGIWTPEAASSYAAAGAMAIIGMGWGLYQKHTSRTKLVTALAMPAATEAAVETKIAAGSQADVGTPKTEQSKIERKP